MPGSEGVIAVGTYVGEVDFGEAAGAVVYVDEGQGDDVGDVVL